MIILGILTNPKCTLVCFKSKAGDIMWTLDSNLELCRELYG